jgi:hypothetical protein
LRDTLLLYDKGHSGAMALDTYGHVFDELDGRAEFPQIVDHVLWALEPIQCPNPT